MSTTAQLVESVRGITDLPADVAFAAKHCVLDWMGCALAGSSEPLARTLESFAREQGGHERATVLGRSFRTSTGWASLLNGAAGHALDFDDTHLTMMGHPSAPVLPAVLALAEAGHCTGEAFLAAFVAGVEAECRLGAMIGPGHYAAGWHSTATLGTFGAAAACAHLLGLDGEKWRHAFGLAGTQAAGLKSVFGSMSKPLHAGKAAMNGLLAARLASDGFTSDVDILDSFAPAHAGSLGPLPADRFLIRDTMFKYHAACYLTHSSIEAALRLRADAGLIEAVEVFVPPGHLSVCNIPEPATGLEGKFSLRATVAMALLGDATGDPAAYNDERVGADDLVALRDRVSVTPASGLGAAESRVVITLRDGTSMEETVDTGKPAEDLDVQWGRLTDKFVALASPVVGTERAWELHRLVEKIETVDYVAFICG